MNKFKKGDLVCLPHIYRLMGWMPVARLIRHRNTIPNRLSYWEVEYKFRQDLLGCHWGEEFLVLVDDLTLVERVIYDVEA